MFVVERPGSRDNAVAELLAALRSMAPASDDSGRISRLRALEELKSAAAALQASETAAFVASQRAAQAAAGVKPERVGRGIAAQVGLALRVSPHRAQRYVGWSKILTGELPHTFAALAAGVTSEWRAQLVARETIFLTREQRAEVDAVIAPRLERLGDRAVEAETRRLAYQLDPAGFVARARAAANERRISIRPAPDTMARLTTLLPAAQAVACFAALGKAADSTTAAGDERGRGQIMADTLVERVTGQAVAGDVPVEVNLVMTDRTLLSGDGEPAVLTGYGPIPAGIARRLITDASATTPTWLRRLFRSPRTGELVTMESRRRLFTSAQRHYLTVLDQTCTTPWCGAPIRHLDHAEPSLDGGPTDLRNGRGTCTACNYAKQAPGWHTTIRRRGRGREIITATPTGHAYRHRSPDPPGTAPPSHTERHFTAALIYDRRPHAA